MALKSTIEQMKNMLFEISHDIEKCVRGNRAAAQRARTSTIKFAKLAKTFRKESIAEGRKGKKATKRKATAKKKAAPKKKVTRKKAAPARKKTVAKRKAPARKKTTARRKKTARRR